MSQGGDYFHPDKNDLIKVLAKCRPKIVKYFPPEAIKDKIEGIKKLISKL